MAEIWKDIPGYEGRYQASTEGRVRSVDHVETCTPRNGMRSYTRFKKGQVLSACLGSNGYAYVGLRKKQNSENADFCPVFHLVALTFLGLRPEKADICHKDGDKSNNRVENLRYDTKTENRIDLYRQGGKYGKLTVEQAIEVKRRLLQGESQNSIARLYGISRTAVRYIKREEHFGWLAI